MGSSFYGNGYAVNGNGTLNYNELKNTPIQNLVGTSSQPVTFSNLNFGNYSVTGYYKYNDEDTIFLEFDPITVQVFKDDVTLKKIVRMEVFENGEYYMVVLIYEEDGTYNIKKFSFSAGGGNLPSEELLDKTKQEAIAESKAYAESLMTLYIL